MEQEVVKYGRILKLKPEYEEEYVKAHAEVWPEVLAAITDAGVSNYNIFLHSGYLFAYMELDADKTLEEAMDAIGQVEICQKWDAWMSKMQEPVEERGKGEWWAKMDRVFYMD